MRFPFYIYCGEWGVAKPSPVACAWNALKEIKDGEKALVICDKSTVEQWTSEVKRVFGCNFEHYANIAVRIEHYEALERGDGPNPRQFALVLVDEAHRFCNACGIASLNACWVGLRVYVSVMLLYT